MDGKDGLTPIDTEITAYLRKIEKPVIYAVNKIDSKKREAILPEFYSLGVESIIPVSAAHSLGIDDLLDAVCSHILAVKTEEKEVVGIPKIAIVGRPNVGKSTVVNTLIGKERMIISEMPGTTRDSIDTLVKYNKKDYIIIDTAGMRKRPKIAEAVERYSVLRALRSIDKCDIAILMIDGFEGMTDQDLKIASYIKDGGKGCIVAVNKWDLVEKDTKTADQYSKAINAKLHFMNYAPILYISALTKQRVAKMYPLIDEIISEYSKRVSTGDLNRVFETIKKGHVPPMHRGREVKFFYITQVSIRPPSFIIFCNYPEAVKEDYIRYMEKGIRNAFGFIGTPIKIFIKKRRGR
jgi:GTP-binding protein